MLTYADLLILLRVPSLVEELALTSDAEARLRRLLRDLARKGGRDDLGGGGGGGEAAGGEADRADRERTLGRHAATSLVLLFLHQ
jgi:hypothetical protein